jgi:hypothetical protein
VLAKMKNRALGDGGRGRGPRTSTERALAEIWSSVLVLESPSVDLDFFEAGGTSMVAVRLLAEVNRRLFLDIPISEFFTREPTIEGMAALIEELRIASGQLTQEHARVY